jgi:hypothetical protein
MANLSENDLRRVGRVVKRVEHEHYNDLPQGGQDSARTPQVEIIRITSTTQVAGRYPGKVVQFESGAGTYADLGDCWVVDVAGGALAVARYPARRVGDTNGRSVFLAGAPGSAGGSLEVKEADGSPDYTGITIIQVDQVTGFLLTQPGAGQAKLAMLSASSSQIGVVDLSAQTLGAGTKKVDSLKVGTTASLPSGVEIFAPGTHALSDNNQTNVGDSSAVAGYGGWACDATGLAVLSGHTGTGAGTHDLLLTIDANARKLKLTSTSDSTQPIYSCRGTDGLSSQVVVLAKITAGGTNGSITVTGGIVTAYTAPT